MFSDSCSWPVFRERCAGEACPAEQRGSAHHSSENMKVDQLAYVKRKRSFKNMDEENESTSSMSIASRIKRIKLQSKRQKAVLPSLQPSLTVSSTSTPTPTSSSKAATEHLLKALHQILTSRNYTNECFSVDVIDDNIYKWRIKIQQEQPKFLQYPGDSMTDEVDLIIELEVLFPQDFPQRPPFFWIVQVPHVLSLNSKFVSSTGSICIHELTMSGWDSRTDLKTLICNIANVLREGVEWLCTGASDPLLITSKEYNEGDARASFERYAKENGWDP